MSRFNKHNGGRSQRQLQLGEEIRQVISTLFLRGEVYDDELGQLSITVSEVRLSPDLQNATVFVTPLGGKAADVAIKRIQQNAAKIRLLLAKMVYLRRVPQLYFKLDDSFDNAHKIETLLKGIVPAPEDK